MEQTTRGTFNHLAFKFNRVGSLFNRYWRYSMSTLRGIYLFHFVMWNPTGRVVSSITLRAFATVKTSMPPESQFHISLKSEKVYSRIIECKCCKWEKLVPSSVGLGQFQNQVFPFHLWGNVAVFICLQHKDSRKLIINKYCPIQWSF